MRTETQAVKNVVLCRPPRVYWFWALFPACYGFTAAAASHAPTKSGPPSPSDTLIWESISAFCLLGTIGIVFWMLRVCVIGSQEGIRWRGLGRWKSVRWEKVSDFYEKLPNNFQRSSGVASPTTVSVVQAAARQVGVTNLWSNVEAFRELVKSQATHAKAQDWDTLGCRSFDSWPRVFDYNTLENRWAPRLWFKLFLTFVFYLFLKPALYLAALAGLIGWATTLMTAGLYLLLVGSVGLIFLIPFAQYRAAGRRKKERITATLDGITFEDDGRRIEAAWAEVTCYEIAPGPNALTLRYRVETQKGSFDFLGGIKQAMLLKAIIQRYAAESADKEWRSRVSPEALGGEAARWSDGVVGRGARMYHYRTRANRALLWLPAALCLMFGLLVGMSGVGLTPGQNSMVGMLASAAVSGLLWSVGWWAYRVCRIETDEDGLTQINPLGRRRRLRWEQVEDYWLTAEGGGVVLGRAERLRFGSGIVGCQELQAEIARRATGCGGQEWAKKPTKTPRDARRPGTTGPISSRRG